MTALGWAVLAHIGGAAADWYTTKRAVIDRDTGRLREGNPIMRWVISRWGETGLACLTFGWVVVMALFAAPPSAHVALAVMHSAMALWNWRMIRRLP
jgi:hypothetical protein